MRKYIPPAIIGGFFAGMFGLTIYTNEIRLREQAEDTAANIATSDVRLHGQLTDYEYGERLEKTPAVKRLSLADRLEGKRYSNETLNIDSVLTLTLKTNDGKNIGVDVFDAPHRSKDGLYALIHSFVGDEITTDDPTVYVSFPKGNLRRSGTYFVPIKGETYFEDNMNFGNKRADRIKIALEEKQ